VLEALQAGIAEQLDDAGLTGTGQASAEVLGVNDDVTHLQGQRIEAVLGQLTGEVRQALARVGGTR
jgi:hypothetical protein